MVDIGDRMRVMSSAAIRQSMLFVRRRAPKACNRVQREIRRAVMTKADDVVWFVRAGEQQLLENRAIVAGYLIAAAAVAAAEFDSWYSRVSAR